MMGITTKPWDIQDYLTVHDDMVAYLDAAFEDGDVDLIVAAIGDVARARGMSELARETGLTREGLSKSLKQGGNPRLRTLLPVLKVLGLKVQVVPAKTIENEAA